MNALLKTVRLHSETDFAFILSHFTGINVVTMFLMVQLIDIFKLIIGLILVRKGTWATNLVEQ